MIKIENITEYGAEAAIRGMRNPMNSWDRSDSIIGPDYVILGENDTTLMITLANNGPTHRKFMRMLTVTMDITAPLYWWKEFDTYKVGTVCNSCSTMHKIHAKEFTVDDFSHEHLLSAEPVPTTVLSPLQFLTELIKALNACRDMYLSTRDKKWWWQLIQLLPSSYNQKRTVQLNYEVLANIYSDRKDHKLDEWRNFCTHVPGYLNFPFLMFCEEGLRGEPPRKKKKD